VARRDIVVVGASAGGVEALIELTRSLPGDMPSAVFVVLHLPPNSSSILPRILDHAGRLPAEQARDGEPIRPGRIYVAPPDYHLLIEDGQVRVVRGPRENGFRPAVDVLFRTAALAYGPRVVGVVLSGALDDGTAGLLAIKRRGGLALVQDPKEALFPGMPRSALQHVEVDRCLKVGELAQALVELAGDPVPAGGGASVSDDMEIEAERATLEPDRLGDDQPGEPSANGCPECGGVLWELRDGDLARFRCRVGHAYSAEVLLREQRDTLEEALWMALRALEERASLARRMAEHAQEREHTLSAARFGQQTREVEQQVEVVRRVLLSNGDPGPMQEAQAREERGEA
jgi:two-component system chemotaxis response regulator CheB